MRVPRCPATDEGQRCILAIDHLYAPHQSEQGHQWGPRRHAEAKVDKRKRLQLAHFLPNDCRRVRLEVLNDGSLIITPLLREAQQP